MNRYYISFRYGDNCGVRPVIDINENWAKLQLLQLLYGNLGRAQIFTAKALREEPIGNRLKM